VDNIEQVQADRIQAVDTGGPLRPSAWTLVEW
jgi:hypothetical protein